MAKEKPEVFEYALLTEQADAEKLIKLADDIRQGRDDLMRLLWTAHEMFVASGNSILYRPWIEQEIGITTEHSYRLIGAYEFEKKTQVDQLGQIPTDAKALLNHKSVPSIAVKEVLKMVKASGKISMREVKGVLKKHTKARVAVPAKKVEKLEKPCPRCDINEWVKDRDTERMKCRQCSYLYGDPLEDEPKSVGRNQPEATFQKIQHLVIELVKEMSRMNFILAGERKSWPEYRTCDKYVKALHTSVVKWEKRAEAEAEVKT